jgi:hypothetical protein
MAATIPADRGHVSESSAPVGEFGTYGHSKHPNIRSDEITRLLEFPVIWSARMT